MMNQNLKRIITVVCTLAMLLTITAPALAIEDVADVPVLDVSASEISIAAIAPAAAEPAAPVAELQEDATQTAKITVESVDLKTKLETATKEVEVKLSISDNPGITGCLLKVSFADGLTLKAITRGDALASLEFTKPGQFTEADPEDSFTVVGSATSPISLVWDGVTNDPDTSNGVLATLTFEVSTAAEGTYAVSASAEAGGIYEGSNQDNTFTDVPVTFAAGGINVIEQIYIPGDVNNDGSVALADKTVLARHLAGWPGYESVALEAADVDGSGAVALQDKTVLARHLAGWPGYEVLPLPKN